MRNVYSKFAGAAAAAVLACGCGGGTGSADPAFQNNVPTYSTLALQMDATDATPPQSAFVTESGGSPTALMAAADGGVSQDPSCHPHLFARTREVTHELNFFVHAILRHVEDLVADHPKMKSNSEHQWESVRDGIARRFTMTKGADGVSFTFKLELAAAVSSGTPAYVTVFTGSSAGSGGTAAVDGGAAGAPTEAQGQMNWDFDALHSVVSSSTAEGQFGFKFDVVRSPVVTKKIIVTFTNWMPSPTDPHGKRNGAYVYYGKPDVGGSLKFQDSLALLCPANPNRVDANVDAIAEWYKASDATLHGRADARATGGQFPAGNLWEGVTCHQGAIVDASNETYWAMKQEDSTGATVNAQSTLAESGNFTSAACDPVFGPVPALENSAQDFPFSASFNADGTLLNQDPFLFSKLQ